MVSPSRNVKVGFCVVAAGLCIALLMYGHPEKLRVPSWLGYTVCATISIAGAALIAKELKYPRAVNGLAIVILLGMLLIAAWLALGSGPRQCFVRGPGLAGISPDWLCRGVFGFGAAILVAMLFLAIRRLLGSRNAG
jgi:asparagine N-glycosylation enzyme membrane subunit Stt3